MTNSGRPPADPLLRWGLPDGATDAEVRKAYRLRVQRMHPDRAGASAATQDAFCALQDDYALIKTAEQRARIVRARHQIPSPPQAASPETPTVAAGSVNAWGVTPYAPASTAHVRLSVPLAAAWRGQTGRVRLMLAAPCPHRQMGRPHTQCGACQGTGQIWRPQVVDVSWPPGQPPGVLRVAGGGHWGSHARGDLHVHLRWTHTHGWMFDPDRGVVRNGWVPRSVWVNGGAWWFPDPLGVFRRITLPPQNSKTSIQLRLHDVGTLNTQPSDPLLVLRPAPRGTGVGVYLSQMARRARAAMDLKVRPNRL